MMTRVLNEHNVLKSEDAMLCKESAKVNTRGQSQAVPNHAGPKKGCPAGRPSAG